jgi:Lrp/AsnC family transcriptional regulator, leucine-responsive regulatory protein
LAAAVHTSAATCLRRVKRLTDSGVIERRVAILSPQKLGAGLTAIVEVTLDRQGAEHLAAFEARAVAEAAVQQCHRVSPGPDFILVLQVADMPAYHALVQRLFSQDANVRNVKSFFSVHRAKFEPRVALPAPT